MHGLRVVPDGGFRQEGALARQPCRLYGMEDADLEGYGVGSCKEMMKLPFDPAGLVDGQLLTLEIQRGTKPDMERHRLLHGESRCEQHHGRRQERRPTLQRKQQIPPTCTVRHGKANRTGHGSRARQPSTCRSRRAGAARCRRPGSRCRRGTGTAPT